MNVERTPATRDGKKTPEYMAWENMRQRCMNPKFKQYADYGGRGISVHPAWLERGGFQLFFADVGPRPSPEYTLDRLDNTRGYAPGNVAWRTRTEQNRNTRKNVYLTYQGERKTLFEWSNLLGIPNSTLRDRLEKKWSVEKILSPHDHRAR